MRVISRRPLREFWETHPQAKAPLVSWFRVMEQSKFLDFNSIKATFRTADYVAPFTVFDIGGNNFRLIAAIHYNTGRVYVRHVFTHHDYDSWSYEMNRRKRKPTKGK
ncbi:MAG: type II toxin-antitoxin system HigB family toxin [Steroidobacteraceae bacterium]